MSLLVNDINFNNLIETIASFSTTNLEKEKNNIKETKVFLMSYEKKKKITNDKIPDFNLLKNKSAIIIKSLNKILLKSYFSFLIKKKRQFYEFIRYVINVSILKKNTIIYISDIKGQLKMFCSASLSLKLLGRQKTMQPKVLVALIKHLVNKLYFSKNKVLFTHKKELPIALHSKYVKKNFLKLISTKLKKNFNIKTINFSNFYPHNGCRYKKIRRLKHRKKNKKIKKTLTFATNYNKKLWKPFFKTKF